MKTPKILLASLLVCSFALSSHAQTTPPPPTDTNHPTPLGGLIVKGEQIFQDLESATNWALTPYATIGSRSATIGKTRSRAFGGGILALYNFNQFVGGGVGIDELAGLDKRGQLTLVSVNVQLELPLQPLAFTKLSWATNFTATPFLYSGIGTPLGGNSALASSAIVHEGEGINFDLFNLWGGKFGGGIAYIQRQNAGVYSGNYWNPFICWHTSF